MRKLYFLAVLILFFAAVDADARVKVKGRGAAINFDPAGLPAQYQASFETMSRKCTKCHTMERTVIAIQTGRAPVTGQTFDKQSIRAYGIKMLRKPNSDLTKKEIKDIVMLLNFIMDENSR
jgi:hypothetical protein